MLLSSRADAVESALGESALLWSNIHHQLSSLDPNATRDRLAGPLLSDTGLQLRALGHPLGRRVLQSEYKDRSNVQTSSGNRLLQAHEVLASAPQNGTTSKGRSSNDDACRSPPNQTASPRDSRGVLLSGGLQPEMSRPSISSPQVINAHSAVLKCIVPAPIERLSGGSQNAPSGLRNQFSVIQGPSRFSGNCAIRGGSDPLHFPR